VGSLLAQSFEGMVIDNDMMGNILRLLRGIEVTDETLAVEVIRNTVFGEGHFLNQPQTLELMQTEYLYPDLGDRRTANDWASGGRQNIYDLAHERVQEILSSHYPEYIEPKVEAAIRSEFPIHLAPEDMKPGNGRWNR
jgi:trimethylamine--corrinoid protein Co-methyltransferase